MKKLLSVGIVLIMLLSFMPVVFAADEPYTIIWNAEDLYRINDDLSGSYILGRDIDMTGFGKFTPIGANGVPFSGIFDGDGHTIKHIRIDERFDCSQGDTPHNAALFETVNGGTVRNLTMEDAGVFSYVDGYKTSDVAFSMSGGIAGLLTGGGLIENCTVTGDIRALADFNSFVRVSGIACNMNSTIRNCAVDAYLLGAANWTNTMVGGISAWDEGSVIEYCCTKGTLFSHNSNGTNYIGGITASGDGMIRNCAALVTSVETVGATAVSGYNTLDTIAPFSSCENNIALIDLAALVPNKSASVISGELAANEATYTSRGWDFDNIWTMGETGPVLRHNSENEFITSDENGVTVKYNDTTMEYYSNILEISGTDPVKVPGGVSTTPLNDFSDADVIIIGEDVPVIEADAFAAFEKASVVIIKGDTVISPDAFDSLKNIPILYFGGSPVITSAFGDDAAADVFAKEGNALTGDLPEGFKVHMISKDGGKVNISGVLDIDVYKFFDLCTLICSEYEDVNEISMDKFICNNLQFFQYNKNTGFTEPIWDHTLTNAVIEVKIADGENWKAITWNELCELGLTGDADSFCLTVIADEYPEIEDAEIKIEDENDPPSIFQRILKFFTSLINKIFSLFSKLK